MSTRREKSKPQLNKQLEAMVEQRPKVNLRKVKERTSNYGNVFSRAIWGHKGVRNLCVAPALQQKKSNDCDI